MVSISLPVARAWSAILLAVVCLSCRASPSGPADAAPLRDPSMAPSGHSRANTAGAVDSGPERSPTCTTDQPCVNGDCIGSSCDMTWECFSHQFHICPTEVIPYCGCDGQTYIFPRTCPEVPYLHVGACGDGVNCDPNDIRCKQPQPDCGFGKTASVVGNCYGPCVEITSCRCAFAYECPERDRYACGDKLRCDFNPDAGR